MKIAFFGLPLAALCLSRDGHDVRLAVLSPIAAPGLRRLRRELSSASVHRAADCSPDVLDQRVRNELKEIRPDLIMSWFWTRHIPSEWLSLAARGGIGVHPSLLPRHRGPNPFFWAIDSGDTTSGISVHWLAEEYDSGNVIFQQQLEIGDRDSWQLARALDRLSLGALRRCIGEAAKGAPLNGQVQDDRAVTWAPEPKGPLLKLDASWDAERALRRIRALAPVPGLALCIRGLDLFVIRAERTAESGPLLPGEAAVWPGPDSRVRLGVRDGALSVERAVLADTGEELDGAGLAARVAILPPDPP